MGWQDRPYYRERTPAFGMGGPGSTGLSVTWWLIIINAAIFMLDAVLLPSRRAAMVAPSPYLSFSISEAIHGLQLWRWVTYQFCHAGFLHLFFNMLGLYFFGPLLEQWWGSRRYLAFYLLCGVSGAVIFTLLHFVPGLIDTSPHTSLVGASGSLFGILAAAAVLYPHHRVMLLFPPIPMSMRTMALIFLGIAAVSILAGGRNAGGEAAHLGGAALGWFLVRRPNLLNFADGLGGGLGNLRLRRMQKAAERRRRGESELQAEVDRILDKVRQSGLQSLSSREKKTLQRATERQRGGR